MSPVSRQPYSAFSKSRLEARDYGYDGATSSGDLPVLATLLSFAIIAIIFVAYSLIQRRRLQQRWAEMQRHAPTHPLFGNGERPDWSTFWAHWRMQTIGADVNPRVRPNMLEVRIEKGTGYGWEACDPLSVSLVRPSIQDASEPPTSESRPSGHHPGRWHWPPRTRHPFATWWSLGFFTLREGTAETFSGGRRTHASGSPLPARTNAEEAQAADGHATTTATPPPSHLDAIIIVTMPCKANSVAGLLPDMALGTVRVPWNAGDI